MSLLMINSAVSLGLAGPASALMNVQSVVQMVLDIIVLEQHPNAMEISSLVLGLAGILLITLGKTLFPTKQ